jgi:DNA-directed RNA polymerase subunit RPC12/RpoP
MFSKEEVIISYTVEKCNKCNKEIKRKFKEGDFLFSETVKCPTCDGKLLIEKIFGESIE